MLLRLAQDGPRNARVYASAEDVRAAAYRTDLRPYAEQSPHVKGRSSAQTVVAFGSDFGRMRQNVLSQRMSVMPNIAIRPTTRVATRGNNPPSIVTASWMRQVAEDRDEIAFRELFSAFGPRVKALLLRQGADIQTAEDIAQETLLTVWRKAHLFHSDKGSVSTWIFTIARNLRIDRLRREVVWYEFNEQTHDRPSDDPLPDENVARNQEGDLIQSILSTLPSEQVEVIRLSYLEGLSHSEISEKLGLPLGTVKSRMRLAYQKVRSAVEGRL